MVLKSDLHSSPCSQVCYFRMQEQASHLFAKSCLFLSNLSCWICISLAKTPLCSSKIHRLFQEWRLSYSGACLKMHHLKWSSSQLDEEAAALCILQLCLDMLTKRAGESIIPILRTSLPTEKQGSSRRAWSLLKGVLLAFQWKGGHMLPDCSAAYRVAEHQEWRPSGLPGEHRW